MKLIKENSKKRKIESIKEYIIDIEQCIVLIYLFCMLGIFPLYYKEQYYKIGTVKLGLFWKVSLGITGIFFVFFCIKIVLNKLMLKRKVKDFKNIFLEFLENLSALDYAVFIYAICVLLSYAFSDYKEFAFKGAAGWEMGLCSQIIFVAIYFIISRQKALSILALIIHLTASSLTFVLGILHRFEIDPLGMYEGLELIHKVEFLSTIGQATWFSSYVCTVFAIGMILFYVSSRKWIRVISGIYTVTSFGILVTQNSDSAFMAIAGIILLLGDFSLRDIKKWCRFWQIMCLMWGTFGGIGLLQKIFADRVIPLDSLSIFFSQSKITLVMLVISLVIMLFYTYCCRNEKKSYTKQIMKITKIIYRGFLLILVIGIIVGIIFIYLNTKGYLLTWFGFQSTHKYLLFDFQWGNRRGAIWMLCWQGFRNLPWFQKLFGVGPDSLAVYLYSIPDIKELLYGLLGDATLTNAHNEYLNSLICYGAVGLVSWLAVLIGGIRYFYNKAKENPFMIAFALCIMGYACHNIFCYQQVCCTPFLFIALGIGESLTKSENFNTIK